jgi:hypothetical protein
MVEEDGGQTSRAPVPYKVIAEALRSGIVVPFLGAGASAAHRPANAVWEPGATFGPFGSELAKLLANEGQFPDDAVAEDLMLVASYFAAEPADPIQLRSRLNDIFFDRNLQPGPVHRLLTSLNALKVRESGQHMPLIMTTNYDCLIESAFENKVHVAVDDIDDPQHVYARLYGEHMFSSKLKKELGRLVHDSTVPIVYKMHGAAYARDDFAGVEGTPRRLVITADDYVQVLAQQYKSLPANIGAILETCHGFLFLGYGLADWNVRVMLSSIKNLEKRKSWAIQQSPLKSMRTIWSRQNVNLYDCDLDEFVSGLAKELGFEELTQ